jgi:peroxiredoxin
MFKNIEGQRVPNVKFKTRRDHEWVDLTSDDIFAGKNVIVFSLPGAFTPTCSSSHVPRYNQLQPCFEANGIDEVICVSVNDAFVMSEWALTQKADRVTFLPDGNGDLPAGRQGRPRLRQAFLALLDARS